MTDNVQFLWSLGIVVSSANNVKFYLFEEALKQKEDDVVWILVDYTDYGLQTRIGEVYFNILFTITEITGDPAMNYTFKTASEQLVK